LDVEGINMQTNRLWHSIAWFGFTASCFLGGGPATEAGAATNAEFADPDPFVSTAGRFRFRFPGEPAVSEVKSGTLTIPATTYLDANRTEYAVMYFDLDPATVKGKDPNLFLEGGVQGMTKSGGWTILSKKAIKLGEYSGFDITGDVKTPTGAGLGQTRMYLVGSRVYQIVIVGQKSKVKLKDFQTYLDSFELIRESPALARANARRAAPAVPAAPNARRARPPMQNRPAAPKKSVTARNAPRNAKAAETATDDDPGPDPSKPAEVAITVSSDSVRLVDLPKEAARSRGRDRELFHETAPKGGLMVGARVGYVNGSRIASVQPIFQVDRSYVDGASQGAAVAGEATVVAKPGYAVGGVNTRTGLLLDGFQLVFMKYEDGRLDPKDTYTSGWLGNPRGGNLKNVSGNGKIVAGIHGSTNKRQINSLGLVVAE
jgi:hypothetical protein